MTAQYFEQGARWHGDLGPSWRDCGEVAEYIWRVYGHRVEIKLLQPVRRLDGAGDSGWAVVVSVSPREGRRGATFTTTQRFGRGGSWKTAPAALHAALRDAEERLREQEQAAAQQAAF
jgi:formylglycine-generating enzyme required for sulfatase activity